MTSTPTEPSTPDELDQDAQPPTPDGQEPDRAMIDADDPTPGSQPRPGSRRRLTGAAQSVAELYTLLPGTIPRLFLAGAAR